MIGSLGSSKKQTQFFMDLWNRATSLHKDLPGAKYKTGDFHDKIQPTPAIKDPLPYIAGRPLPGTIRTYGDTGTGTGTVQ